MSTNSEYINCRLHDSSVYCSCLSTHNDIKMRTVCVFLLVIVVAIFIENSVAEECREGQAKREECNTCRCVKGGVWSCTKRVCVSKREVKCKPGSTTFDECGNLCTCNEAGVTICTRRGCKTATS